MSDMFAWKQQFPSLSWATLNAIVQEKQIVDKEACCARVASGYPLAYLLGRAPFGPTDLVIAEPLLIPRPETWDWLASILPRITPGSQALDLGCGPGTISWALAAFFPEQLSLVASDISEQALECARKNLSQAPLAHCEFVLSSWFDNIPKTSRFDLIVSNPPYCDILEKCWMENTCYESDSALFASHGGLSCYQHIISQAPEYLSAHGCLILEHGAGQGSSISMLLEHWGFSCWAPIYDTMGAWRATWAKRA